MNGRSAKEDIEEAYANIQNFNLKMVSLGHDNWALETADGKSFITEQNTCLPVTYTPNYREPWKMQGVSISIDPCWGCGCWCPILGNWNHFLKNKKKGHLAGQQNLFLRRYGISKSQYKNHGLSFDEKWGSDWSDDTRKMEGRAECNSCVYIREKIIEIARKSGNPGRWIRDNFKTSTPLKGETVVRGDNWRSGMDNLLRGWNRVGSTRRKEIFRFS